MMAGIQLVLQCEQPGGGFECLGFTGLPIARPAFIALASTGTPETQAYVQNLRRGLLREFTVLAPNMLPVLLMPCGGHAYEPSGCHAVSDPYCQKLLVLIGDAARPLPPAPYHGRWLAGGPDFNVLPVFPLAARPSIGSLLPPAYNHLNVDFWSQSIVEAIPAVLARSGLAVENPRIFISYRQRDSSALAMQLFDALSHENFDPFLDHFRIPPGVNFQSRLTEELGNKSMVLLIESANILDSEWTTYEINVAKTCSLGIFALHVPGGVYVAGIDPSIREDVSDGMFEGGAFTPNAELLPGPLAALVGRIKLEHDRALATRRQMLLSSLEGALLQNGIGGPFPAGPGGLRVHSPTGKEYLVWITPRPPALTDFHAVHGQTVAPERGVVIGLSRLMEPGSLARTDWLAGLCQIELIDEGQMKQAAAQMAQGVL
jgi:hypothetical protein